MGATNHVYHVKYRLHGHYSEVKGVDVLAHNKEEALFKAEYEAIPEKEEGKYAFMLWLHSVTYQNGNCRYF